MKKKLKTTLLSVFLLLLPISLLQAQGLYKSESSKPQSLYGTENKKNVSENGTPTLRAGIGDDGEPEGDDELPVSEGLLLLAVLAGAGYAVQGAKRKMNN